MTFAESKSLDLPTMFRRGKLGEATTGDHGVILTTSISRGKFFGQGDVLEVYPDVHVGIGFHFG